MAANVESMFSVRFVPWHGLGTIVKEAPTSDDAIRLAGLDWKVVQGPAYSRYNKKEIIIPNHKANIRDSDGMILGVVKDRYKIVQNSEAFAFTDALLGEGITYETARRVWKAEA